MKNSWLTRVERKLESVAISHLMYYICGGMLIVFLTDFLLPEIGFGALLTLDISKVAQGEVWRLITFIFSPINSSPIWILFSLYFYCLIGESLEREWGSFRFGLFYLTGAIGTILAALIVGYGINVYLNLSIFLAFAFFYPDFQVTIFFFLPIKIKYLAILDLAFMLFSFFIGSWIVRLAILISLLNVILYFGRYFLSNFRSWLSFQKTRRNFRKYMK